MPRGSDTLFSNCVYEDEIVARVQMLILRSLRHQEIGHRYEHITAAYHISADMSMDIQKDRCWGLPSVAGQCGGPFLLDYRQTWLGKIDVDEVHRSASAYKRRAGREHYREAADQSFQSTFGTRERKCRCRVRAWSGACCTKLWRRDLI